MEDVEATGGGDFGDGLCLCLLSLWDGLYVL